MSQSSALNAAKVDNNIVRRCSHDETHKRYETFNCPTMHCSIAAFNMHAVASRHTTWNVERGMRL